MSHKGEIPIPIYYENLVIRPRGVIENDATYNRLRIPVLNFIPYSKYYANQVYSTKPHEYTYKQVYNEKLDKRVMKRDLRPNIHEIANRLGVATLETCVITGKMKLKATPITECNPRKLLIELMTNVITQT